jgi:hypothetical protein
VEDAIQGKQSPIDTDTDLSCNSINVIDKYSYTLNSVVKPFGLYGETLHYYQVEDDLETFINSSNISEGDTIIFPSGDIAGNVAIGEVVSVKFIGIREETTNFLGTFDIGVSNPNDNYLCRFENITFQGLVTVAGGEKAHIFKNCSFEGGITLSGSASSVDNPNIQFIDCIIRTLTVSEDYSTTTLGKALFRRCDFKGKPINALQNIRGQVVLDTCYRVADDHRISDFNYELFGTTTRDVFHNSYNIASTYYVDIDPNNLTPLVDRELTTKYYVDSEILTNTNNLTSVQTQVDALINFTGGGVNFRAYTLSNATQSAGQNLNYNIIDYDTENSYDASDNIYTIVIGGTYVFTLGWSSIGDTTAVINLIRKRNSVESILQQSTNGTNTANHSAFFLTTIAECETDDEIYAYLDSGPCRLIPYNYNYPTTVTSFSGSRISN